MPQPPSPPSPRDPSPGRAAASLLLLGAGATAAATLLLLWAVAQVGSTPVWRVEAVVGPAVVTGGALAAAWLGVSALLASACALARTAGGTWRAGEAAVHRWAPGLVRRVLTVAVAATVGLGTAVGAQGAGSPGDAPVVTVDLGWSPTAAGSTAPRAPGPDGTLPAATAYATSDHRPTDDDVTTPAPPPAAPSGTSPAAGSPPSPAPQQVAALVPRAEPRTTAQPHTTGGPPAAPPEGQVVVVRAGDTLWGIAARTLGPGASDAAVAAEWPRWYAANATTIGPDPDVLQPGQVLTVPTTGSPR